MGTHEADSVEDVVVVVPGIMGTQLKRKGEPVWMMSGKALWNGIRTLGGSIKSLELPSDIGDEHPNDGVTVAGLMPDVHGLPGKAPFVGGYSALTKWLRNQFNLAPATPDRPGNLVEFGYDWRLSNRYSANRLKETAEDELKRWRDDGHPDAELVFVCHSMGGLVARYYLEVLGGAEHTRTLITIGTPHCGSVNSLRDLTNGRRFAGIDVTALARSLPSSYQLLPTYRCMVDGSGGRKLLADSDVGPIDGKRLTDAGDFHREIAEAAGRNGESYNLRMVVGTRQPTFATATVKDDRITPLNTIDEKDLRGDGTVARFASIPEGFDPRDTRQLSSPRKHGHLQQSQAFLDDLHGILTARDVVMMSEPAEIERQLAVKLPDLLDPFEELRVEVRSIDPELRLTARLAKVEEGGAEHEVTLSNRGEGSYSTNFGPLEEGLYSVTVTGLPHSGIEPISDHLLVSK